MIWINANKKFLVAALGALIATVAALIHKPIDDATTQAIIGGIFAALVWLAPNTPPPAPPAKGNPDATGPVDVPRMPKPPSAFRIYALAFASVVLSALSAAIVASMCSGCLTARDAHDVTKLTLDEIQCIESQPDGATTEQVAITCGLQSLPDVFALIEDLLAQKRAAAKQGVTWKPIHHDGGAP